ncbi:MAG: diaminopropionate ammonia-lyase [Clostridia bacterium]|nr:diaminopropionate ammonia-lyase [Clostridia bacterium]
MKLTFLGANHEVTGSRTLLEWMDGRYLLVDDGMSQGIEKYERAPLPVEPDQIEYVLLTHAHIDHSGMLPLLARRGFRGRIYATAETIRLSRIMLLDSASVQERDAEAQTRKNLRAGGEPVEPMYTAADVENVMRLFRPCPYGQLIPIDEGLSVRFTDAGHLLGSASVECFLREDEREVSVVFSGDVGNTDQPIIRDPQPLAGADYLILESTYGDRLHDRGADPLPYLAEALGRTFGRGGSVIIPSFAVGRTQELLYFFRQLKLRGLPVNCRDFPVYLDSPLAEEATAVFLQCSEDCLDEEARAIMRAGENPIWFEGLHTVVTVEESQALNSDRRPKVIIASGGMCDGGRIRHHLKHHLWRPEDLILFAGYQAEGTLGRRIYDGAEEVRILGEKIKVRAEVALLQGVSGHADRQGLLRFAEGMEKRPKRIFIDHGEDAASEALASLLRERLGVPTDVPWSGSRFDLAGDAWEHLALPVRKGDREREIPAEILRVYGAETAGRVMAWHETLPGYTRTPLVSLKELAGYLGLGSLWVKDESRRFFLNAFKGLGASYAIGRLLQARLERRGAGDADLEELRREARGLTFVTATDGNHGRGVAWAARLFGAKAVVYLPAGTARERLENIRALGARAEMTDLSYDDTVRLAAGKAEEEHWILLQDTAWPGYETVPRWIMQGYTTMGAEIAEQLGAERPTHVFLQAGVGSMAGALAAFFADRYGSDRPRIVVVEPEGADGLCRTAEAGDGKLHAPEKLETIMAGLKCGEPCTLAWEILKECADAFVRIPDRAAAKAMRVLGAPLDGDPRVVSGESGAAGLGAVLELLQNGDRADLAGRLALGAGSRVLVISTEGATDRENYRHIVWDGWYPDL